MVLCNEYNKVGGEMSYKSLKELFTLDDDSSRMRSDEDREVVKEYKSLDRS